jgi:hypothetical protein
LSPGCLVGVRDSRRNRKLSAVFLLATTVRVSFDHNFSGSKKTEIERPRIGESVEHQVIGFLNRVDRGLADHETVRTTRLERRIFER